MPRSKRKASSQDFQKKKTKLGGRARSDNITNTKVKHKQIFVPDQSRPQHELNSTLKGLSLPELSSRTRHHNSYTRTAAFNAITNAITNANAMAHADIILTPSIALNAAAIGVGDVESVVRNAARNLLLAVWQSLKDVRPFRSVAATALLACMSHIRLDIRLHAARTFSLLHQINRQSAAQFFDGAANPLEPLCDMLKVTTSPRSKTIVLDAIFDSCDFAKNADHTVSNLDQAVSDTTSVSQQRKGSPFYYHRTSVFSKQTVSLCSKLPLKITSSLISFIMHVITECFPLSESQRDTNVVNLLHSALNALLALVASTKPIDQETEITRLIGLCSRTGNGKRAKTIQVQLARIAIYVGHFDLCQKYIAEALESRDSPDGLETCIVEMLEKTENSNGVMNSWIKRFERASEDKNVSFFRRSLKICDTIFRAHEIEDKLLWRLIRSIPVALESDINTKAKGRQENALISNKLVRMCCRCYKLLHEREADREELASIVKKLLETVCSTRVAMKMEIATWDEVVGITVAAQLIMSDTVVRFIGQCSKNGEHVVAQRFLAGIEAAVITDRGNSLRAIAVGRAIRLLDKNDAGEGFADQLIRIEAAIYA